MATQHERLQEARARAGYSSATAAAQAFGWPVSTYLGHENGSRGLRSDAASRYARAFGVSWIWLMGKDDAFQGVTELLTEISVIGFLDPGAFRSPGMKMDGVPSAIHLQVFGYHPEELRAFAVYGSPDQHFIIAAKHGILTIGDGDEVVVRRMAGGRIEIAAWRLVHDQDFKPTLVAAYTSHSSVAPEPFEMLDEPDSEVLGVVVAELRVKRRAEMPTNTSE